MPLLDDEHLSRTKVGGRLAVIPLEGCDRGVVLAGYAGEGVSAPDLVQAVMAGLGGARGGRFPPGHPSFSRGFP